MKRIFPRIQNIQIAFSIVAALGLLSACGKDAPPSGAPEGPGQMAMPVTVIEAKIQKVPVIVETVGQTEGSKEVEVRARASGILTRQFYKEGDNVKAGVTLFTIDRASYENVLAQARAALAQERANFERAQREADRLKTLVAQKAISQKEYDDARTAHKFAEAALMASEARVREAELNLSYTNVTAPISGLTGRALRSEGSLVMPGNESGLLTTMTVNDPIWVRFSFSEEEMQQLRRAKNKAEVKLLLPDGSTYGKTGKINFAASVVDRRTGAVALRAEFPNPDQTLLPGQFVRVLATTGRQDAFLIPQSALLQSDQGKLAFMVSPDNKVTPHPVETAGWLGQDWIVTKGIAPGNKIIIDNLMKLRPGAPVAPHAPGQSPAESVAASAPAPADSGKREPPMAK